MLISFNWKAAHPVAVVTEVELWDKLPAPKTVDAPTPVVEEKTEKKQEPRLIVGEKPKPEEPKVDISLEKKKKVLAQKEVDEQRKKDAFEKLQQEAREDELKDKKTVEKKNKDALKKLQQEALSDEKAVGEKQANAANSAANASIIGEYTEKIKAKIRGNVNKTLCGEGNPQLMFKVNVLPTGQLGGTPKVTKSSGSDACDEAVERAIIASEPLPLPEDASLKSQFKNLNLTFRPND